MKKYENFSIDEFICSNTAKAKGIDNTPTPEIEAHLDELITNILQPLRTAWGKPLKVNSGYRCPELNKAVGGSKTSAHLYGYAADIVPVSSDISEFIQFAERWLKENDVKFDQSINEKSGKSRWWHIGIKSGSGKQRCQFMTLSK